MTQGGKASLPAAALPVALPASTKPEPTEEAAFDQNNSYSERRGREGCEFRRRGDDTNAAYTSVSNNSDVDVVIRIISSSACQMPTAIICKLPTAKQNSDEKLLLLHLLQPLQSHQLLRLTPSRTAQTRSSSPHIYQPYGREENASDHGPYRKEKRYMIYKLFRRFGHLSCDKSC
jgi:hypothetical protein